MATCPNCGREAWRIRTLYADGIDDVIEVQCRKCGILLAKEPPEWIAA